MLEAANILVRLDAVIRELLELRAELVASLPAAEACGVIGSHLHLNWPPQTKRSNFR